MQLFGFGAPKNYLGVDLGTSSIKIVELQSKSGRAQLLTYGYVEQPTDVVRSSSASMEQKIIDIVKAIYRDSRMSSKKVIAALPSFSVFNSIISLPEMGKKELTQAIHWEAKKFIPLPINEMMLDWKIISPAEKKEIKKKILVKDNLTQLAKEKAKDNLSAANSIDPNLPIQTYAAARSSAQPNKLLSPTSNHSDNSNPPALTDLNSGHNSPVTSVDKFLNLKKIFNLHKNQAASREDKKNIKILLTAAPKTLVERYIHIFQSAGLELLKLETESFALERSLISGNFSPVIVIDIGSLSTDIAIIDNGIPILTRSIDVGGATITKAVMTSLNIDEQRAEQFKRDIGFSASGSGDLPEIIKATINPIINEVKYSLDIYLSQADNSNKVIDKIVLTGGSAFLPELPKYLNKLLDIKTIIGDPWDKVVYPLELKPVLQNLGPRFSVAVGLAMREI